MSAKDQMSSYVPYDGHCSLPGSEYGNGIHQIDKKKRKGSGQKQETGFLTDVHVDDVINKGSRDNRDNPERQRERVKNWVYSSTGYHQKQGTW